MINGETSERTTVKASFAAGCFWGTQRYYKKHFGDRLKCQRVGYMGGKVTDPTYTDVRTGQTGHAEVLHIEYDPKDIDFYDLAHFFFRMHNPTTANRQGDDEGTQYRSTIFFHDDHQKQVAEELVARINGGDDDTHKKLHATFGKVSKVTTTVEPAGHFWDAEEYHQEYLDANPTALCVHRIHWDY